MQRLLVVLTLTSLSACNAEPAEPAGPPEPAPALAPAPAATVPLTDLSTSLVALRTDFNAHRGEVRFLTLLSPT